MKLIPAAGFALVLAAAPCFAPLAFAPSAIAQGLSGDAARAAAATQYLASAATSNFQASQLAAIPHPPRESDACPGGAQEALQHQIETLMAGSPDYDAMAPSVANQWRNEIDSGAP
jgi:hypothetical protein